jgi:cell division protein FtsW (lipid II flippase)
MEKGHKMSGTMDPQMHGSPYRTLALNLGLSLIVMYVAMFAMIWSSGEFIQNINFFYMALVMWAPMAIVMLLTMGAMYPDKRRNLLLYGFFALVLVLSFVAIRGQALVGDRQFLRSMIPHHSGAILMCEQAQLSDPEIKQLCGNIVVSQKAEIAQMKTLLERK